jgi:predicted GNAT family acetyltransferase
VKSYVLSLPPGDHRRYAQPMADVVEHREQGNRGEFFIERGGARVAEMTYQRLSAFLILVDHTHVDVSLRGGGVARQLLDAAVTWARQNGVKIDATCSYVVAQFARDKSLRDVNARSA